MLSCSIAQISGQTYKMLLLSMAYFMTLSATQITLSTNTRLSSERWMGKSWKEATMVSFEVKNASLIHSSTEQPWLGKD